MVFIKDGIKKIENSVKRVDINDQCIVRDGDKYYHTVLINDVMKGYVLRHSDFSLIRDTNTWEKFIMQPKNVSFTLSSDSLTKATKSLMGKSTIDFHSVMDTAKLLKTQLTDIPSEFLPAIVKHLLKEQVRIHADIQHITDSKMVGMINGIKNGNIDTMRRLAVKDLLNFDYNTFNENKVKDTNVKNTDSSLMEHLLGACDALASIEA